MTSQMSPELLDMLDKMKASGFNVTFTNTDRYKGIGITVEDRSSDLAPLEYVAERDDDEATVFVDFSTKVVEKFGWDDADLFEAQMRQQFRDARATLRASTAWDEAAVRKAHDAAKAEMLAFEERGEYDERLILTPEAAEDLLLRHQKVRRRRGLPDPDKKNGTDGIDFVKALGDETFTNQRRKSQPHEDRLQEIIGDGRMMLTHQGAAIDPEGFIFDGHHRITAIAKGIVPAAIKITYNANPLTMPVIDTGKPRGIGDVMSMYGISNGGAIGSVVRILYNFDHHPADFTRWTDKLDPQLATQAFAEHYVGAIESYKAAAVATSKHTNHLSPSGLAAAHFLILRQWPDAPIDAFMRSIRGPFPDPLYNTRYNTDSKRAQHPALKLVEWAASDVARSQKRERRKGALGQRNNSHFIMSLRAWNSTCLSKTVGHYTWVEPEAVPEIFGM